MGNWEVKVCGFQEAVVGEELLFPPIGFVDMAGLVEDHSLNSKPRPRHHAYKNVAGQIVKWN